MSRIRNAKSDFDQRERVKSFSGLIFSWQNRSVGDQQQQKAWKSKKVELVWPILIMNKTSVVPRAEFEWNYVGMLVEWSASKLPIKDFLGHISVDLRVHEHLCISLRALWVPPLALVPFLKGANWFFFHLHHDQKYYYLHTWGNHEILNLFETQPELSSKKSNMDFSKACTNAIYTKYQEESENSFLKCLVMSKVIYFVIWIVSTLLLEKISESEKL